MKEDMRMKKRIYGFILLTLMMMVLSGCRMYADYTVNGDGTITSSGSVAYTQEEAAMLDEASKAKMTIQTLEDGKTYYVAPAETETKTVAGMQEDGIIMNNDIFFCQAGSVEELLGEESADVLYMQLSVSLLSDIVDSNANVSVEGKKASFSYTNNQSTYWYAYTLAGKQMIDADVELPQMKGATDQEYCKNMPSVEFTDNIAVREVKLNGQVVSPVTTTITKTNGKKITETTWYAAGGKKASKKGKNVFEVTDLKGNVATYTIYVDNKKPVVKGIQSKKTYNKKATMYVKDSHKLAKVTINGKSQKLTNKKLVKKGKYKNYYKITISKKGRNKIVVQDEAGNKKSLTITIKK